MATRTTGPPTGEEDGTCGRSDADVCSVVLVYVSVFEIDVENHASICLS